jgi:hypothetical protein
MGECRYSSTILTLGTTPTWVTSFSSQPFYPRGNRPRYPLDRKMGRPRTGMDVMEKRESSCPDRESNLFRPARSPSLYRLSSLGCFLAGRAAGRLVSWMEGHGFGVYEDGMLRRIFGPNREEARGSWWKLYSEELYNLYSLPNSLNTDRVIKNY